MNFITVFSTPNSFQIAIIRNLFDLEGIAYRIFDDVMNSAAGIAGLGNHGVRVQVSEDDYIKARYIIDKAEF